VGLAQGLKRMIEKIKTNEPDIKRKSRLQILNKFSLEIMVQKTEAVFKELLLKANRA
jgi:hypothetical protein